ncbi:ATP-grasp domain-containing protein [Halorussus aquaticus]|uniref:RimK family alpha-L-glutamate ligase n=1 Tax=Halorussus aquaticus TaxID=2953748 RepID=A0ABD5Q2H4_9EURY|nr:ATP-grasp domain-containing protein [Halorussus aquaticus]
MAVLLVESSEQAEMTLLADAIEERGHEAVRCDVLEWPGDSPITVAPGTDDAVFGTTLDYEDVTGMYVNCHRLFRPAEPRFNDRLDEDFAAALNQIREYRGLFESLCLTLQRHGAEVVPKVRKQNWQDWKPWQLHLYENTDLPVPDTVFTNDPDEVRSFAEAHDRVVFKAVTRGGSPHVMTDDDLTEERLDKLATAPVQFQEYVEGEDVRVYVVDGEVVGAIRYESDTDNFSFKIDIKEGHSIETEAATLSNDVVDTVTRAAEAAGLTYTAADVRQRPDGSHVLLELNEAPKFSAADRQADQDVAGAVAEFLIP